jgi:outer membrane receptor for ferrienterochelin and colicin
MVKKCLLVILVLLLHAGQLVSQQTGTVSGEVVDGKTQAFLQGVLVKILGTDYGTITGENGAFELKNVPVGIYELEFTNVAYQTLILSNIVLSSGKINQLMIELQSISTDEVVVESSRFYKPTDATTSYMSLTFEELRRTPGGLEDIGRVIQNLPGVSFASDGRNDIVVRGGSPSENLFIVDGFQVNNINHFGSQGATGGPISILNIDFVREVSFLTGGFSARYGDRLSSVVDIKLRDGNFDRFFGKINLSGTGFGANFEGPLPTKNKASWLVSARKSYLDLIFNATGFSFVPEYTDFQTKLHFHVNQKNFINFSSFAAIDKVRFNNDTEDKKRDNERILTNNQNSYSAGISWKSLLTSNSFSVISISRNFTDYFFSQRDASFDEIFNNNSKEGDVLLKIEYTQSPDVNTFLTFGTGGQTIKLDYNICKSADTLDFIDPVSGNKIIVPPIEILENKRTYKAFAYGEIVQKLMNRFRLTLGVRYDYFNLIEKKNYISPRASLSTALSEKLSLNLAYGIFYQSPSYIWLVGSTSNLSLKNMRADHYITGFEYLFDASTKLSFEIYYKLYKNYPVSTVRPYLILANNGGFETQNSFGLEKLVSNGSGTAKGFELFLQKALTKSLYGTISFSYSDVKYIALDGIERRSDYDNRYVLNIAGGYKLGKGWEVSTKFRLTGGRPYTPINPANGTLDYTSYNSLTLPIYHRLDLRTEKRWDFKVWTLTTYIDIQNIYNRQNVFQYRWDEYKKEIVADRNLGILPSLGISAEF